MPHVFQALFVVFLFFAAQVIFGRALLLHSGLAEGLCQFQNQFKTTKQMFSRLEENNVTPKIPISWLQWRKCENNQCTPFTTNNDRKTKKELSIMIELRNSPLCKGHEIECFDPQNCPGQPKSKTRSSSNAQYLQDHAKATQASILEILHSESKSRSAKITIDPLWITNIIVVRGTDLPSVKQMLANHKDVKTIRIEHEFSLIKHTVVQITTELPRMSTKSVNTTSDYWGHEELNIEDLHKLGITGENITVGIIGSGVDYTHVQLGTKWRTKYGWFDPFVKSQFPTDNKVGDGTSCMGIMVAGGRIGVAPKAKWIACKACRDGVCTESSTLKCAQWMLCPTKADGTDPDCSKKPHVVTNVWGFPPKQDNKNYLDAMLECWLQEGIVPVFPVGGSGPDCSSTVYPASSTKAIGVGVLAFVKDSSNITTQVHSKSSRGPSFTNAQVIKPDFVAPGFGVVSIGPGKTLQKLTGTPAAAAFVAGTIALMRSANTSLSVNDIINNLRLSARHTKLHKDGKNCGNIAESDYPNNYVGYGSINAYKAVLLKDP